jgi:LacI family transcriptional regulator
LAARMKDIAADLGVSLMTVSKALRSHSDISEETRNRVLRRARELNYQPNWVARSLVMRRTFLVGLVIPDLMHSFFAEVATGVARKLGPLGYQIVISNSDEDARVEQRQLELLAARNVDGLILASASTNGRKSVIETLRMREVPFVLIDRMPPGISANYVGSRDEEIGQMATEHLIEQGCRHIAHIRGPATPNSHGRLRGYRKALRAHGMEASEAYVAGGVRDDAGGYAAMRTLLALKPRPDGVFGYNDPVAAGAIKAVLEAGLRVPQDVAVIGAGNVHYSDLLRVPLSTVDQSSAFIGEAAAGLLVECMEAKTPLEPKRILVPPRLVARESTRRKRI